MGIRKFVYPTDNFDIFFITQLGIYKFIQFLVF